MRVLSMARVVRAGLTAKTLHADELLPGKMFICFDPVYDGLGPITSCADKFETSLPIVDNRFSGRFSGSQFDTAVSETSSALDFEIGLSGEIFPFPSLSGSITDAGNPSSFLIMATLPTPAITDPTTYALGGGLSTGGEAPQNSTTRARFRTRVTARISRPRGSSCSSDRRGCPLQFLRARACRAS